jgi:hypothetical protein
MTTFYFLVSLPSGLNIPNYKNNLLRVDRKPKEFKTLELCITYYVYIITRHVYIVQCPLQLQQPSGVKCQCIVFNRSKTVLLVRIIFKA